MGNSESVASDPLEQFPSNKSAETSSESVTTDYGVLLDEEHLKKALAIFPNVDLLPIAKTADKIRKWLVGLLRHGPDVMVTMDEFVHTVRDFGVPLEDCKLFFNHLDRYGEGSIAAVTLVSELSGSTLRVSNILTGLVPCRLEPNVCDVFVDSKSTSFDFALQLMEFLQRNRASCDYLVSSSLESHLSLMKLRETYVRACFSSEMKEEEEVEEHQDGRRVTVAKCYQSISVSSNPGAQMNLLDRSTNTYWQSNGSPRTHWIRIHCLPGTALSELAIAVDCSDESYMPQHVTVSVGNSQASLTEIKSHMIPKETMGKFVLVKNLVNPYKLAQVNIKRCHRDGCDARVRGILVKGCRYTASVLPSVGDSVAVWYLSMMSMTAQAAMPLAPSLKPMLLQQTKSTLCSLKPLALSCTSQEKPEILDSFVVAELTKFVKSLCHKGESLGTVELDPEEISILLNFMLIVGEVNGILDTLQCCLENKHFSFSCQRLMCSLTKIAAEKRNIRAIPIQLKVLSCDGGEKDEEYKVENCISLPARPSQTGNDQSSPQPYVTAEGKKVLNIIVCHTNNQLFDVGMITLSGQKGGQSPKMAVVFLLKDLPKSDDHDFFESFSKYDTLSREEIESLMKSGDNLGPAKLAGVVLLENEEDVTNCLRFDKCTPCRGVYVKFLGTVAENSERMGVRNITVLGTAMQDCVALYSYHDILESDFPEPVEAQVPATTIIGRIIGFMIQMLFDLKVLKDRLSLIEQDVSTLTEAHVSVQSLSLETIWSLYFPFAMEQTPASKSLSVLCLLLLYASLPFVHERSKVAGKEGSAADTSKTILTHLCALIDDDDEDQATKDIAQECIVAGIPVFYASTAVRQEQLMEMLSNVNKEQSNSWMLRFRGLCQYFVVRDSFKLLQLPAKFTSPDQVKLDDVLAVLSRIVEVTCKQVDLNTEDTGLEEKEMLVHLLQAVQQNLFHWCARGLEEKKTKLRDLAASIILRYTIHFLEKMEILLPHLVRRLADQPPASGNLPVSVITGVLPQLLYFLSTLHFSNSFYCLKLLQNLKVLLDSLCSIQQKHLDLFPAVPVKPSTPEADSDEKNKEDKKEKKDKSHVLNVWARECSSVADPEVSKEEKFACPTATKMVVEFDPSCSTSRRYDKLEFNGGSTSTAESVHGSYGSSEWPKTLEFATSELCFKFKATSSTNTWSYKFVVRAYGPKLNRISFFTDLQLTTAHVLGSLSSHLIALQYQLEDEAVEEDEDKEKEQGASDKAKEMGVKAEKWLIGSNLWKKLFRGGMTDKFTRSLSTMHTSVPVGSALNAQLVHLAEGSSQEALLEQCKAGYKGPQMHYGGKQVDEAILAAFAALVWHSQVVRDEIGDRALSATQGVKDAYAMAQYLRRELVEARQKVLANDFEGTATSQKALEDADKPVNDCLNKALFLLRFAGLARDKKLEPGAEQFSSSNSKLIYIDKCRRLYKANSLTTSPDVSSDSQGSTLETEKTLAAKYPSFSTMMEFFRKTSVTKEMVERFLTHRQKSAKNLSAVLNMILDLLRSMDPFSGVGLSFLRQLLSCQHNFSSHYVHDLEGCGLEVENEVRRTYRQIVARLLEEIKPYTLRKSTLALTPEVLLAESCLLHLLDVQWQNYDMAFVSEMQLPEFLLAAAIHAGYEHFSSPLPKQEREEEMLRRHRLFSNYSRVAQSATSLSDMMSRLDEDHLNKEVHLFVVSAVAHFSDLSIRVQCDACSSTISGSWYRDLDVMDMDLCRKCFFDHPEKRPVEYHISHKFLELRHNCDVCRVRISSHRLHSETKADYDLCLGCFRQREEEGSLDPNDRWSLYPLTLMAPEKDSINAYYTHSQDHVTAVAVAAAKANDDKTATRPLQAYVSQHAFLQFTQICLSTARALNASEKDVEESYLNALAVIYFDCLKLLTFCMRCAIASKEASAKEDTDSVTAPEEQDDEQTATARPTLLRVTSITDHPEVFDEVGEMGEMEKSFSYGLLGKLMGLLALMLPLEKQLPKWVTKNPNVSQLLSERLLPSLIEISRSSNSEHSAQALCLLSQFFVRLSPQTADQACLSVQGGGGLTEGQAGLMTVEYLCATGAHHLENSDFASASTVSRMVQRLGGCHSWKSIVAAQLNSCLSKKPQEMSMQDAFKLYTLAGFPGLPCIGTLMEFGEGAEARKAVIVSSSNTADVSLVTLDKREPMMSSLQTLRMLDPPVGCVEETHIKGLIALLEQLHKMSAAAFTTESLFVLSLALKALRTAVTTVETDKLDLLLSDSKMMSWIGAVARKPTEMDKKWLLHHLEAYLVNSYHQRSKGEASTPLAAEEQPKEEEKKPPVKEDPREGLSVAAHDMFDIMLDAFNCTPAVLRAAYDISSGNVEAWMRLLENCFEDSVFRPSERILEKAKDWDPKPVRVLAEKIQEGGDDSGLVNFSPRKIDIENVTAVSEVGSLKLKFSVEAKDIKDEKDKDAKMEEESLEMLLKALKKLEGTPLESSQLYKTARAVAILQARELIVSILTHWPWRRDRDRRLSLKVLLGETETMKNFGMVDLICSTETEHGAKMVVQNIMEYGDPTEVQELVLVAAACMGELVVGTESAEGTTTEEKTVKGTIVIQNASSITVTFAEKSNFNGKITLTSSVKGTGEVRFDGGQLAGKMHILPGDTVNYEVTYTTTDQTDVFWKMDIVGSQTGRFDTGCTILKMWLSQARTRNWNLPLTDLWPHLVLVACQNPGQKRLQIIGLLLKVLALYKETVNAGRSTQETPEEIPRIDLSLLKPLWKLYYNILGEVEACDDEIKLIPDIVKALTELFMVMESFGKDLGGDDQLLNDFWVNEKVMTFFQQGVSNVAFVSIGAGLTNKLATIFQDSKNRQDLGAIASLSFNTSKDKGDADDEDSDDDSDGSSSSVTSDDSDDYTTDHDSEYYTDYS